MAHSHLFKYRSLKDYKRFLDIVVNKRLHACNYRDLNDPMEGVFCYSSDIPREYIDNLRKDKTNTLICSLSQNFDNGLMWSYYADEHKGCCIEVEVTSKKWEELIVDYKTDIYSLNTSTPNSLEDVLSRKSLYWQHEEEVRYIRTFDMGSRVSPYVSIKIHKIWLGMKVDDKEINFIKKLIKSINPNLPVEKIKREKIDFGYNI